MPTRSLYLLMERFMAGDIQIWDNWDWVSIRTVVSSMEDKIMQ